MVPCILVDREGLGNEWLLNVCGYRRCDCNGQKARCQSEGSNERRIPPCPRSGARARMAGYYSLKMKSCLETVWLFDEKQCLFYTHSSVDRLEPTTMVCTSFLFVLDHCNVGRIDRDSGSRSMDHGRINREGWQWKLYFCLSVSSILVQPVAQSKLDHIGFFNVQAK